MVNKETRILINSFIYFIFTDYAYLSFDSSVTKNLQCNLDFHSTRPQKLALRKSSLSFSLTTPSNYIHPQLRSAYVLISVPNVPLPSHFSTSFTSKVLHNSQNSTTLEIFLSGSPVSTSGNPLASFYMFRNSLNQPGVSNQLPDETTTESLEEEVGDEYYEFDGARLEIKHNATIRQSGVSIAPKITPASGYQSSILEGSDSIHSPVDKINPFNAMADAGEEIRSPF